MLFSLSYTQRKNKYILIFLLVLANMKKNVEEYTIAYGSFAFFFLMPLARTNNYSLRLLECIGRRYKHIRRKKKKENCMHAQ